MAPMADLLQYCEDLPVLSVPAGEVLIDEGGQPSRMFVLVSGSVTIEKDLVPFARIDHPGAVFGEMSWVLDRSATATVRAATPVEVHVIDDPDSFLTGNPGAAVAVLRMTAMRLDGLTQYLVDVKQQFAGLTGHLGMVDQILDSLVHHQSGPTRTGSVRDPEC
jgi:CRP/FNR family transcriptional regulator, cyclic AMP receptor protein